jgi:PLP dependent protein
MTASSLTAEIRDRLHRIQDNIPPSVRLVAVSKQVPVEAMRAAYDAGVRDFGESRIQEAIAKQEQLQDLADVTWHMIGHLQANKAAKALELFQWIHSVDSLKLAQRLDRLAAERPEKPNILLQVKILPDPNKAGWTVSDLMNDLSALDQLPHLNIMGLMTIPPYGLESTETLSVFKRTFELADTIQQQTWSRLKMIHLSMGMSDDYLLAVQAGSTMIRPGRILFGERN